MIVSRWRELTLRLKNCMMSTDEMIFWSAGERIDRLEKTSSFWLLSRLFELANELDRITLIIVIKQILAISQPSQPHTTYSYLQNVFCLDLEMELFIFLLIKIIEFIKYILIILVLWKFT